MWREEEIEYTGLGKNLELEPWWLALGNMWNPEAAAVSEAKMP